MSLKRKTIIFYLPLSMESLTKDLVATSSIPSISGGVSEKPLANSKDTTNGIYWDKKRMYVNPDSFNISNTKIIKESQTKGGFMIQYWGEQLTNVELRGTTGSAGIEGINILKDIYRHEQLQIAKVIDNC